MQRDPLGNVEGTNLYLYVAGSPTFYLDPTGLKLTQVQCEELAGFITSQEAILEEYKAILKGKDNYKRLGELNRKHKTIATAGGERSEYYEEAPPEIKHIIDVHESYHLWNPGYLLVGILRLYSLDSFAKSLAEEEIRAYAISNRLFKELYADQCTCKEEDTEKETPQEERVAKE